MKIIFAVDGTGLWSDAAYSEEMQDSFVSRIHRGDREGGVQTYYQRGPSLTGIESSFYGARQFLNYLSELRKNKANEPIDIYITGYSRGAMIATYLANRIHEFNTIHGFYTTTKHALKRKFGFDNEAPAPISIKSMLLFDAVDSDLTMWGPGIGKVPPSVAHVSHFICGESSVGLPRSRWYFNRIKLSGPKDKIDVQPYTCTHACIGGLPGQGDHRTPIPSTADLTKAALIRKSVIAPSTAARTLWDAVKSNVTREQDLQIFPHIERMVLRKLATHRWPAQLAPRMVAMR